MNIMLEQFNLPRYIDGLSFADASKKIQSKFKERTDLESINTEKEMLDRLKQMQEHVKAQQEAQEEPERSGGDLVAGSEGMPLDEEEITQEYNQEQGAEEDLMSQMQSAYGGNQYAYGGLGEETPQWKDYMQGQSKMALGGDEEYLHSMPDTAPQRFAPTIRAQNDSIFSSLASIGKSAVSSLAPVPEVPGGQMVWGGPVPDGGSEYYTNNNPLFMQDQPSFNGQVVPPEATAPVTPEAKPGVGTSGKIAGGVEALTAAASLGKDAFGQSNVDTSGRVHVEKQKIGNAMVSGAAKGAKVGSEIGKYIPIPGAGVIATAASSVIGAGLGYLGSKKQRKAADIANRNATYADAAVNDNQFDMGGEEMNRFDGGGNENKAQAARAKVVAKANKSKSAVKVVPKTSGYGADGKFIKPVISREIDADLMSLIKKDSPEVTGVQAGFEKYYNEQQAKKPKSTFNKVKDAILDNKDALRYAPALGNIMQLAKLKKPEQETTPELSTRYKKNVVDEQGLVNLVREETAGNREAILSSSEGSGNAARANLLGTQLNATKALSDAFMKSQEANARENAQEQSFNLGVDTTNLQQQTLAQDIRARNKGAYDTEKSRLKTAIGADLGSIGQEELYKKFPELIGSDYDWEGKYKKLKAEIDSTKKA